MSTRHRSSARPLFEAGVFVPGDIGVDPDIPGTSVITIEHLTKTYRHRGTDITALDDVSLTVERGEIFGVVGESGAGKSTLIRCVNLLERPTSGRILIDGTDITTMRGAALRRARQNIGMIFQGFNLLDSRSVAGNVALPLEVMGIGGRERKSRVAELLDLVGLGHRAGAHPARLSGGQKQRVGIARALAGSPGILLSDEATSALDPVTTASILELLQRLNRELGLTILLITHEMDVVKRICNRVALLEDGRITEQGSVRELARDPRTRLARALFGGSANGAAVEGSQRVVVGFDERLSLETLLPGLLRHDGLSVSVVSADVETVGDARIGNVALDLGGSAIEPAIAWIRQQGGEVRVA
jgi:D-methionine transport system ATP-binding protein